MTIDLELRSLSANWNRRRPVWGYDLGRSISLKVESGSWVFVAGANGVGKSTLLHAIAGTVPFVAGEISVSGIELRQDDKHARFRAGVQMVEQHAFFQESLAWRDAIDLSRMNRPALYNEKAISSLEARLRNLGWIGPRDLLPPRLFDLALGILSCPQILLLDEIVPAWPTTSVPVPKIYEEIRSLLPRATVLFTEHSVNDAVQVADRVLWLRPKDSPLYFSARDSRTAELLASLGRGSESEDELFEPERAGAGWHHIIRLDRSPREQIRLALQARKGHAGLSTAGLLQLEREIYGDFPFLSSEEPAEALSGGQRTVLRWFMLTFSGAGEMPDVLLRHLDAANRARLASWATR